MKLFLNLMSILWCVLSIPGCLFALMSPMMFDAPGSEKLIAMQLAFWSVLTFPLMCLVSVIGMWMFYGRGQTTAANVAAALPCVNVLVVVVLCVMETIGKRGG